jgi:TctA family transporter
MLFTILAPAVLAIFLDPLTETSMRPARLLGDASFSTFSNRPMAASITIITLLPRAMRLFSFFRQQLWLSAGT